MKAISYIIIIPYLVIKAIITVIVAVVAGLIIGSIRSLIDCILMIHRAWIRHKAKTTIEI